jgi:DNA-binding MarR family transcriptional regulator
MTNLQSDYESADESPGFLLWQVSNAWQRQQREALAAVDLTHVQFVLLASIGWLTRDDQPVTQVQLAQHAHVDVMTTSDVLRTLERKQLLVREPAPHDSRANVLRLTPAGRERAQQAMALVEAVDAQFFAALGDDTAQFARLLRTLRST